MLALLPLLKGLSVQQDNLREIRNFNWKLAAHFEAIHVGTNVPSGFICWVPQQVYKSSGRKLAWQPFNSK